MDRHTGPQTIRKICTGFGISFFWMYRKCFDQTEDADLIKNLNMYVLSRFYTKSYEENRDFMSNFMNLVLEQKTSEPGSMIPGLRSFFE